MENQQKKLPGHAPSTLGVHCIGCRDTAEIKGVDVAGHSAANNSKHFQNRHEVRCPGCNTWSRAQPLIEDILGIGPAPKSVSGAVFQHPEQGAKYLVRKYPDYIPFVWIFCKGQQPIMFTPANQSFETQTLQTNTANPWKRRNTHSGRQAGCYSKSSHRGILLTSDPHHPHSSSL